MRLRQRVLLIFLGLGVLPILAVGWMAQQRTLAAIEDLVADQARERAVRTAEAMDALYRPRRSELLYFLENAETIRLLRDGVGGSGVDGGEFAGEGIDGGRVEGDGADTDPSEPDPRVHLQSAWASLGASFQSLEFLSPSGETVFRLENPDPPRTTGLRAVRPPDDLVVNEPVVDPGTGAILGAVQLSLRAELVIPIISETSGFGTMGRIFVVDRPTSSIVGHPRRGAVGTLLATELAGLQATELAGLQNESTPITLPDPGEALHLVSGDSITVAVAVHVPRTPWAVVSLASMNEFSTSVARTGNRTLGFVVLIAALALLVALAATKRAMGSLDALTVAAGEIAKGDLSPELPEPSQDEVGTLTRAFRVMVGEIDRMLRRVEENRQLAAVGEFASQVAHEIRNPLTAIRVNLQALRRDLADSPLAEHHGRPLDITIGEVDRLDRVTRGVLTLAQRPMKDPKPVHLHEEVRTAIATLEPELKGMHVSAETSFTAESDEVLGDAPALRGAILNLLHNAAEAMAGGGTIHLATERVDQGRLLRLHVVDEGQGIPSAIEDRLFDPFATTKEQGSGLGLAVALRTAEAHGGDLRLGPGEGPGLGTGDEPGGAHFIMDLPTNPEGEQGRNRP